MSFPFGFKKMLRDEDGAVTVDWVVLAAVVVSIGTGVASAIMPGITTAGSQIQSEITSAHKNGTGE